MKQEYKAMRHERVQELNPEHASKRAGVNKWIRPVLAMAAAASLMLAPCGCKPRGTAPWGPQKDTVAQAPASKDTAATDTAAHERKLPRLLDLGAHACIPCKMMAPILDDLKQNWGEVFITEFIDVWQNPDAGKQHGIEGIPTQIFFDAEGNERYRHTGFLGKEDILAKWKELGVERSAKADAQP